MTEGIAPVTMELIQRIVTTQYSALLKEQRLGPEAMMQAVIRESEKLKKQKRMSKKGKRKVGRPLKIDAIVLGKLEDAFSNALPDKEACLYAGINPDTLYEYQKRNPKFTERKEALKLHPNIAARKTIVSALGDVKVAQWFLEKKDPDFRPSSKVEHSGKIQTESTADPATQAAIKAYEETRAEQIRKETRQMP